MPVAGIWKSSWLPYTETFIRDQVQAVVDWKFVKLGYTNLPHGIDVAAYAPYPPNLTGKLSRNLLGTRPFISNYVQKLQAANAQILHAHFGPGGVEALPISRAAAIPLITTFHGADAIRSQSSVPWRRHGYARDLAELLNTSVGYVAASRYIADMLLESGASPEKITLLYTGTKPRPVAEVNRREGIVFVGRLIDIKGPMDLLRAVSMMPADLRKETPVTLVGDGPLRVELEKFAMDMKLDVRFTGRVDSAMIPQILRSHRVFCAPSLPSKHGTREGFGMVFLEAALQELPCVAYASGGVTEAVIHEVSGLLAPEGDIPGLSIYLTELLLNSATGEDFGAAGRQRVLKDFDMDQQASKLASLYSRLS